MKKLIKNPHTRIGAFFLVLLLVGCAISEPVENQETPSIQNTSLSELASPTVTAYLPVSSTPTTIPIRTLQEVASSVTPTPTNSPTPILVKQTVIIPVSADSYVYAHPSSTAANYGQRQTLTLGADSDANSYSILLDFNLENYSIPQNALILQANLHAMASANIFEGFPFTIYPLSTSWNENTVTAGSLPLYNETLAISQYLENSDLAVSFPITEIVSSWINGEIQEYGIVLVANVLQNTATFIAKEGPENTPIYLEIIFESSAVIEVVDVEDIEPTTGNMFNWPESTPEPLSLSELRDNGHIVFQTYPDWGGREIHVINSDGSGEQRIALGESPDISPDGKLVAFEYLLGGSPNVDIFVISLDGSESRRITTDEAKDINPIWSPTGDELMYLSEREDRGWYVTNVETGETRKEYPDWLRLTATTGPFEGWKATNCRVDLETGGTKLDICLEKADEAVNLTKDIFWFDVGVSTNPWSPDGRYIVVDDSARLYIIEIETRKYVQLQIAQRARDAHWGPDSTDNE